MENVRRHILGSINRLERPTVADEEADRGLRQAQASMRDTAVHNYMQCLAAGAPACSVCARLQMSMHYPAYVFT